MEKGRGKEIKSQTDIRGEEERENMNVIMRKREKRNKEIRRGRMIISQTYIRGEEKE